MRVLRLSLLILTVLVAVTCLLVATPAKSATPEFWSSKIVDTTALAVTTKVCSERYGYTAVKSQDTFINELLGLEKLAAIDLDVSEDEINSLIVANIKVIGKLISESADPNYCLAQSRQHPEALKLGK